MLATAALLGSCGDGGPELEELPGDQASGPGFVFNLPNGWEAVADRQDFLDYLADQGEDAPPGLDLGTGFAAGGLWINQERESQRPTVNVLIEPVTRDTDFTIFARSLDLVERFESPDSPVQRKPAVVDGEQAVRYAYSTDDGDVQVRGIAARRGDLGYVTTVRIEDATDAEIDALADRVASSWRWRSLTPAQGDELQSIREFSGSGYRVVVPDGWRATGKEALEESAEEASGAQRTALTGVDSLWRGFVGSRNSTNVQVRVNPAPTSSIKEAVDLVKREERQLARSDPKGQLNIREGAELVLDGEPARSLLLEGTLGSSALRAIEVVALHDDMLYTIVFFPGAPNRYSEDARAFREALMSWRWE